MTDISELIHRLKVAAKKVTPGPWITVDYFWISQKSVGLGGEFMQFNNGPDAEYVKHCSPDNILTLTAALEKAQARIAELEARTVIVPGTKCIGWLREEIKIHDEKWKASLSAAGIKWETE